MNAKEIQELAQLLNKVPGIRPVEMKDVTKLAELLRQSPEIGSIEMRGWFGTGVVITRTGSAPAGFGAAPPTAVMPAPAGSVAAHVSAGGPAATTLKEIRSPMVGTFYKAPEPGAEPYVKVGSRVTTGQTVCIIEAMKIMNEIEAEVSGTVREVCVDDASPVEFGTVLYRVDPNG